jgi:hypothetical protein
MADNAGKWFLWFLFLIPNACNKPKIKDVDLLYTDEDLVALTPTVKFEGEAENAYFSLQIPYACKKLSSNSYATLTLGLDNGNSQYTINKRVENVFSREYLAYLITDTAKVGVNGYAYGTYDLENFDIDQLKLSNFVDNYYNVRFTISFYRNDFNVVNLYTKGNIDLDDQTYQLLRFSNERY